MGAPIFFVDAPLNCFTIRSTVGATCGRPLPQRVWPGAAVARQAVLPSGTSGSGRETLVKSGLARRSAEAPPKGLARRGYIRGGQPLMRTLW